MVRRRINISADEELYNKLKRMTLFFGFKSVCKCCVSVLKTACLRIETERRKQSAEAENDDEFICGMFREMGDYEYRRREEQTKRRRNRRLSDGEG